MEQAKAAFARRGRTMYAYISGEIDHHAADSLRGEIDDVVLRAAPEKLVFDLLGVGFMDSSGVGLILGRCRLMEALGGRVQVQNAPPVLHKMLALSGLGAVAELL